jgi:hypothetical protein
MSKKALSRDALLSQKVKIEEVDLSEFGMDGSVYVKGLNTAELDAYQMSLLKKPGSSQELNLSNQRAKLCVHAICDENGKRMYGEPGDVDRLAQVPGEIINKIYTVAARLAGLGGDKEAAELEKNSDSGQSGENSSD